MQLHATKTFLFWNFSGSSLARLNRVFTDGPWGHMGGGFDLSDGTSEIYEALFGRGFIGPTPLRSLKAWQLRQPERKMAIVYLDLDEEQSEVKRQTCKRMVGTIGYAEFQLVLMGLFERYGLPVPRSPRRVVCSEAWSRILHPEMDLRDRRRRRDDYVNPNSAWRRMLEIKCGFAGFTGPNI